jgi:hypothetical protein
LLTNNENQEIIKSDNEQSSSSNENCINILIRFVNENILKIKVQPNDTIGLIKKYIYKIIRNKYYNKRIFF